MIRRTTPTISAAHSSSLARRTRSARSSREAGRQGREVVDQVGRRVTRARAARLAVRGVVARDDSGVRGVGRGARAIASKIIPMFLLMPALWSRLPLSGIAGVVYAAPVQSARQPPAVVRHEAGQARNSSAVGDCRTSHATLTRALTPRCNPQRGVRARDVARVDADEPSPRHRRLSSSLVAPPSLVRSPSSRVKVGGRARRSRSTSTPRASMRSSQDLAEALTAELDVDAVGGLEVRRQLPADGVPPDCVTTPACTPTSPKRTACRSCCSS